MERAEKYYEGSDSELNFRAICKMDDEDPVIKKKDILKNLDLLIKTAFSVIETAKNENEKEGYENAYFSWLGDQIMKLGVPINNYTKNMIIDKAILKHYVLGNNYMGPRLSISEIITHYNPSSKFEKDNSVLYKYKNYTKAMYCFHKPVEAMLKAINKFNYNYYRPISKSVFERHTYQMISKRLDDECMMVFGILLIKCGARMDSLCFNFITDEIDKKREEKNFDDYETVVTKYYLNAFVI